MDRRCTANNSHTVGHFANDMIDKCRDFYVNFEQKVYDHVVSKINEVVEVEIKSQKDIVELQKNYCMYLIIADLENTKFVNGYLTARKGLEFFIEEPNPDARGIHTMKCGVLFQKNEDGIWEAI